MPSAPRAGAAVRARLTIARAEIQELQGAKLAGSLVRIQDVTATVAGEYSRVRERLVSIPGKMAMLLVGLSALEIEARLRDEIYEAMDELKADDDVDRRDAHTG
jgi:phage terminase Nu1 subunit (DNA packaging protein)